MLHVFVSIFLPLSFSLQRYSGTEIFTARLTFQRSAADFATPFQPQAATANYVPLEHESEWVLAVVLFTFLESGWKVRNRVLSSKTIINTD